MMYAMIGFVLGYFVCGIKNQQENIPKELERLRRDNEELKYDLGYYKKLSKTLADENMEFRKKQHE